MWVGDVNINDPNIAVRLPFRWKVNNKRANRNEIRREWLAIRSNGYPDAITEDYFKELTVLYVDDLKVDKI